MLANKINSEYTDSYIRPDACRCFGMLGGMKKLNAIFSHKEVMDTYACVYVHAQGTHMHCIAGKFGTVKVCKICDSPN